MRESGYDNAAVTWRHLNRLYTLGLGPDSRYYTRHGYGCYASLTDFQLDIGSPTNNPNSAFGDWTIDDYTTYSKRLIEKLGKVPTAKEYAIHANDGKSPTYEVIKNRIGGILRLHDLIGYPNIAAWDEPDFIDWGVQALRANPHETFSPLLCDVLSKRKRGPSSKHVINVFKKWSYYKEQVITEESSMTNVVDAEMVHNNKVKLYKSMIATGNLPESFKTLQPGKLVQQSARYMVAQQCLQGTPSKVITSIVAKDTFVMGILKRNPDLTAGHVENVATRQELYDDIWPADDPLLYLHVTSDDMEHQRSIRREKLRQRRYKNDEMLGQTA